MKLAVLTVLAGSAAAFAPSPMVTSNTALNMAFEDTLGSQPPLGFWDPLGLVADGDQAKFDRLRYTELKHGRVSMLATVGYLIGKSGLTFPGDISLDGTKFSDVGSGFDALSTIPAGGFAQIFLLAGFLELFVMQDITGTGEFVGDFRNEFIDFGWDTFDETTKLQKRAIELNNGRAAMMGILALMVHEKLDVSIIPDLS